MLVGRHTPGGRVWLDQVADLAEHGQLHQLVEGQDTWQEERVARVRDHRSPQEDVGPAGVPGGDDHVRQQGQRPARPCYRTVDRAGLAAQPPQSVVAGTWRYNRLIAVEYRSDEELGVLADMNRPDRER